MNHAPTFRRLFAIAIVVSPFIVIACSTPASHPAIIGDCTGANCPPQGEVAGGGTSGTGTGTGDGSTTSTGDGSTTADDSGITGDDGSTIGSE